MVALSVSAPVSRVNFGLRQLNRKGGKCRQYDFLTHFCSMRVRGKCPCVC